MEVKGLGTDTDPQTSLNLTHDLRRLCEPAPMNPSFQAKTPGQSLNPRGCNSSRGLSFLQKLGNQSANPTQNQGAGERQSPLSPHKSERQVPGQLPHTQSPQPGREAIDQYQGQKHDQDPANHGSALLFIIGRVCMGERLTRCENDPRLESPSDPNRQRSPPQAPRL